jgi:hypothetical protein
MGFCAKVDLRAKVMSVDIQCDVCQKSIEDLLKGWVLYRDQDGVSKIRTVHVDCHPLEGRRGWCMFNLTTYVHDLQDV